MNLYCIINSIRDRFFQTQNTYVLATWDEREWFLKGLCTDYFGWMPWDMEVHLLAEDTGLPQDFYNKEEVNHLLPEDWKDKEYLYV